MGSGLILGAKALNTGIKVLGISVFESRRTKSMTGFVSKLVNDTAQLLDVDLSIGKGDVTILDGYSEGYGIINKGKVDAIKFVAQTEGIFLDPVYTGSAMAGLIDLVRKGHFDKDDNVIFIHTGGNAALFPYREPIKSILKSEKPITLTILLTSFIWALRRLFHACLALQALLRLRLKRRWSCRTC